MNFAKPYIDGLRELRKSYDLYPWVELLEATVPASSAVGYKNTLSLQQSYAQVIGDTTQVSMDVSGAGVLSVATEMQVRRQSADESLRALRSSGVIGEYNKIWLNFLAGRKVAPNELLNFDVSTLAATGVVADGRNYIVGRGYRLWPKGTQGVEQLTFREMKQRGMKLDHFTQGVRLTLPNSVAEVSSVFKFTDDYVIRGITITDGTDSLISTTGSQLLRIDADRPIFSGDASKFGLRYLVTGADGRTAWWFPIPITVAKNTEWTFRMKHFVVPGATIDVDIVLHGGRLTRAKGGGRTPPRGTVRGPQKPSQR